MSDVPQPETQPEAQPEIQPETQPEAQQKEKQKKVEPSTLYVVATPIGNLEDMTFRAVRVLQQVDWIAAEDTRHTGKLLQAFAIKTPQVSYHEHNRSQRIPDLIRRLEAGEAIALVSDAGIPLISDPGSDLVCACIAQGIAVVPIPGVSAVTTALCAAGISTERFAFEGFLPAKPKARRERLAGLQSETRTLLFYESPHRLQAMLKDMLAVLGGDRRLVLARELTKLHEEFWRGTIAEAIAQTEARRPQGEYTLVLSGAMPQTVSPSEADLTMELEALLRQGLSRSSASRHLAQATGLPRRQIYQLALSIAGSVPAPAPESGL